VGGAAVGSIVLLLLLLLLLLLQIAKGVHDLVESVAQ
jgi:hypothetical protein